MRRSVIDVVLGVVASVGAFFIALQLGWLAEIKATWFPYVAQPVGVALAGLAMAKASRTYTSWYGFVIGAASVGSLALLSRSAPHVFTFTAAWSTNAMFSLPVLSLICGLAGAAGAWFGSIDDHRASVAWAALVTAFAASAAIQLGSRALAVLAPHATEMDVLIANNVFTFLIGAAIQTLVPRRAIEAAAAGVAALMAIAVIAIVKREIHFDSGSVARTVVPVILTAAAGAALIWWRSSDRA